MIYSNLEHKMSEYTQEYGNELARLLLIYGDNFNTFYSLLDSDNPFGRSVDVVMKQDFQMNTREINYQFDIMNDQREAFLKTVEFLSNHGSHFENLVVSAARGTPVISIHITKTVAI
jgi:hypothetical protein